MESLAKARKWYTPAAGQNHEDMIFPLWPGGGGVYFSFADPWPALCSGEVAGPVFPRYPRLIKKIHPFERLSVELALTQHLEKAADGH